MKLGTIRLRNLGTAPVELTLEPEGACFSLGSSEEKAFSLDGPLPMDLVVDVSEGKVLLFVWRGVAVEHLDDPEEFRRDFPAPRVP